MSDGGDEYGVRKVLEHMVRALWFGCMLAHQRSTETVYDKCIPRSLGEVRWDIVKTI